MAIDPIKPETTIPKTFLNVSVKPGDSWWALVFTATKSGAKISGARLASDASARFATNRLKEAFPRVGQTLEAFPFLQPLLHSTIPPILGFAAHNRWLPTSDSNQETLAEWCLTATIGHAVKLFDRLGDDFFDALVQAGENEIEKFKKNPLGNDGRA